MKTLLFCGGCCLWYKRKTRIFLKKIKLRV
jgi:hypothetical protein